MAVNKRKSGDQLLAVRPDGHYRNVPCTYEGIKDGLDDATFDFVHTEHVGMYIDDESLLKELPFNVPASIFMARALFGPIVLCAAQPDDEGDTLPALKREVEALAAVCRLWQQVLVDAERLGQIVVALANPDTVPPPQIYNMSDEDMERFLSTGQLPNREPDR
jgi:hypothetical protein